MHKIFSFGIDLNKLMPHISNKLLLIISKVEERTKQEIGNNKNILIESDEFKELVEYISNNLNSFRLDLGPGESCCIC